MMRIAVNANAKAYAADSIDIQASAKRVFQLIANVSAWPEWQSAVRSATIEGEPCEGANFKWKAGGSRITSKFHTFLPPREIGWTGRILWITAVHNWWIDPLGENVCRVRAEESIGGFLSGKLANTLRTSMRKNLQELKATAEQPLP